MGDWKSDAPGVRRKITVNDLPAPSSNVFAINRARVINRPANAQPQVPPGFKIELYASGFHDPRFLLTAPNGDIFVVESRANQIKVLGAGNQVEVPAERTGKPPLIGEEPVTARIRRRAVGLSAPEEGAWQLRLAEQAKTSAGLVLEPG